MTRLLMIMFGFLMALTTIPVAAGADPYECDDLDNYQETLFEAIDRDDLETVTEILDQELETVRPSEMREASRIMDDWATEIEDIPSREVPRVAQDYHEAFLDYLSVASSMMNSMASGGVFGALAYDEAMTKITTDLEAANQYGESKCGEDWPFEGGAGDEV
jgi:hypothetical protein